MTDASAAQLSPQRAAARPAITRIPNLTAVASGKGGVGKTWFSATFSHSLARNGARVLLIDGDLGLANVDVQLGLTPGNDIASVMAGSIPVHAAIQKVDGGSANIGRGFDVLAGRSGSGALGSLKPNELFGLIKQISELAETYDHVILDLGAGIDASVRLMCNAAGKIFVILTDEPTSLTDAYALVKVLTMRNPDSPIEIIVNMVESPAEGRRAYRALAHACQTFLGGEPTLAGIIRRDKQVKQAIRQQAPLLSKYPQSIAGADIEGLTLAQNSIKT